MPKRLKTIKVSEKIVGDFLVTTTKVGNETEKELRINFLKETNKVSFLLSGFKIVKSFLI